MDLPEVKSRAARRPTAGALRGHSALKGGKTAPKTPVNQGNPALGRIGHELRHMKDWARKRAGYLLDIRPFSSALGRGCYHLPLLLKLWPPS
ncbi:MAG: hypothetical protein ABI563_00390, partial [Specibacter sp.]